jgi:hypothetical protein
VSREDACGPAYCLALPERSNSEQAPNLARLVPMGTDTSDKFMGEPQVGPLVYETPRDEVSLVVRGRRKVTVPLSIASR